MSSINLSKIIERIECRVTKVTIPTKYREDFSNYLTGRKVQLERPPKTDVWNNVESAYTEFELSIAYEIAGLIFDEWVTQKHLEDALVDPI